MKSINKNQKGSTLLFTVMVLAFVMTMGLATVQVVIAELKISSDVANSKATANAALGGAELGLFSFANSTGLYNSGAEYTSTVKLYPSRGHAFLGRGKYLVTQANKNVVKVYPMLATSGHFAFALTQDGYLFGAGYNGEYDGFERFGLGDTNQRVWWTFIEDEVITVAAGNGHSMILKADGSVWTIGNNDSGQLGLGDTNGRNKWTKTSLLDIIDISAGNSSSYAIDRNGDLWVTGTNTTYQLGLGHNNQVNSWQKVTTISDVKEIAANANGSDGRALALKDNGTLYVVGDNEGGEIGLGSGVTVATSWQEITAFSNVRSIAAGIFHSMVALNSGEVWATGDNGWGAFGDGTETSVYSWTKINTITDVVQVSPTFSGTLALKTDGSVWGAGYNSMGDLGIGYCNWQPNTSWTQTSLAGIKTVSSMNSSSYAIDANNNLWATGSEEFGQLGRGTDYYSWICDWDQSSFMKL